MTHRTVEELWYCVSGLGEFWRKLGSDEQVLILNEFDDAPLKLFLMALYLFAHVAHAFHMRISQRLCGGI